MKGMSGVLGALALLALAACGNGSNGSAPAGGDGDGDPPAATAPAITTQPQAQTVTAPAPATFSVVASGTAPLAYQWRSSDNGTDWTDIAGATGASYATGATDTGMNGRWYSAVVSNSAGSVTSSAAQLTVIAGAASGGLQPLAGAVEPFPHPPAPLAATPVNGSQQDRAIISWAPADTWSGTAALTHGNGTKTWLQFPGGAFRDEVGLVLTEITDLGAPVSAVLAALRVEPSELLADKPITVSFIIPDAVMAGVDRDQLVGVVADSDGANLHLVPLLNGNFGTGLSRPAMQIDHLGIVGIAVATADQQAALAAAWPTDTGDQLAAALAPLLTAQWREGAQALASVTTAKRSARPLAARPVAKTDESPQLAPLRGYFNDVVVPAFAAAYGDPAQIPAAIQIGFSFLRNAALTGLAAPGGPLADVASDLEGRISSLLDTYADYVAEQCRSIGGPPELQLMLGTIRQLQLLGHGDKAAELQDILPQCSRFKVGFRQDFTRSGRWSTGGATYDTNEHTIVEGETTVGLNEPQLISDLHLSTATLDETLSSSDGNGGTRSNHTSWVPEDNTSPWGVWGLSIPVVRTKSGTPSTSLSLTLHAYGQDAYGYRLIPLEVTATVQRWDGQTAVYPDTPVLLPLSVPALPLNADHSYGPILIPRSGSVSSQSVRTVPLDGGSVNETERVTVTIKRDD